MREGRMRATTVRFSADLWDALEEECARLGVSAAQYLREAAVARLAYTAGRRGDYDYAVALVTDGAPPPREQAVNGRRAIDRAEGRRARAGGAAEASLEQTGDTNAVAAQSELVRMRAQKIREESKRLRGRRPPDLPEVAT
jgi:hypothetical protein